MTPTANEGAPARYTLLPGTKASVKVWTDPWTIEPQAAQQLRNIGAPPRVEGVAVMPDVYFGKCATVGSVIAMRKALAPAAVGVDIGCGMSAVRTNLTEADLPDDLGALRSSIEAAVPVGFNAHEDPVNKRRPTILLALTTACCYHDWIRRSASTEESGPHIDSPVAASVKSKPIGQTPPDPA